MFFVVLGGFSICIVLFQRKPGRYGLKERQYLKESLSEALHKLQGKPRLVQGKKGRYSISRVAQQYGIPYATLHDHISGKVSSLANPGPSTFLSKEEESMLEEHLMQMAGYGYGYTRTETRMLATDFAIAIDKRTKSDPPLSSTWLSGFINRNPQLKTVKPRALSMARAKASTPEKISQYFDELQTVMEKYHLQDKPHLIYNLDEKGISTEHHPPKSLGSKEESAQAIVSPRMNITIIGCGNALGTQIPPYYIFPGKRLNAELLADSSPGSSGTMTESGWSNTVVLGTYLEDHFLKYAQRNPNEKLLLIYDGHVSHAAMSILQWAKDHNIVLLILPAHTSHVLQPLDVACFGPLQKVYDKECAAYMKANIGSTITKFDVARLASKAYTKGLSIENLRSAFRKTGIYPLDSNAYDASKITPAQLLNPPQAKESPPSLHHL